MNVRELIKHLNDLPGNLQVYTAIDAEGNGYNSFEWAPTVMYADKDGHELIVFNTMEEAEEEGYPAAEEVVIIG